MRVDGVQIGAGAPTYIIAEIGINHNGSLFTAEKLIDLAAGAGCQAVKFQKRTVDVVYSAEELAKPRENIFGATNGDLKRGLEFGREAYEHIARHCRKAGISWFASPWDIGSVDFLEDVGATSYKIASACLTDLELLSRIAQTGKPVFMSTGMSSDEQVRAAVDTLCPDKNVSQLALMHCTSVYPCPPELCNLDRLYELEQQYDCVIGYSGHETGLAPSLAAVAMGAEVIERHITLDRSMWGSDQSASLEPEGLKRLVRDIRCIELAMDRVDTSEAERPTREKLRRVG